MAIDLSFAEGKQVFIQMKGPVYIVEKQQGQLGPAALQDQQGNVRPMAIDFLVGTVRSEGEGETKQYILHYNGPNKTKVRVLINPDEIRQVCWESPIEVVTGMPDSPLEQ